MNVSVPPTHSVTFRRSGARGYNRKAGLRLEPHSGGNPPWSSSPRCPSPTEWRRLSGGLRVGAAPLTAVAQGAPIRSFASVAGWFHDTTTGGALFGVAAGVESRLRRAQDAIDRYLQDGEIVMVPAYDTGNLAAGMVLKIEYYGGPGAAQFPNGATRWRR